MKFVVFGLSVSSSWGNGHATIWRGLIKGLASRGHTVVFFEKDVPYYAQHRDLVELPGMELVLYKNWDVVAAYARRCLTWADVGIVTSYCPDAQAAQDAIMTSGVPAKIFYDLDTPVTLQQIAQGSQPAYVGRNGYGDFDLVLSYTGGIALDETRRALGAQRVEPLYGCVDPATHGPVAAADGYRADLSYLGTYAADRQDALNGLFIVPARQLPSYRFIIGGAQYPDDFPWTDNIAFKRHVPPSEHPQFYCSADFTLNVTRQAMAAMGFCPSGRLFEAAACGATILSDSWAGIDHFFSPGSEIVLVTTSSEVIDALAMSQENRIAIGRAARERALAQHTCYRRAEELEAIVRSM